MRLSDAAWCSKPRDETESPRLKEPAEKQRDKEQGVNVTVEKNDALTLIQLEGAIDIGCASQLKAELLEAFQSGKSIRISAAGVSELDVTAYQLLWAASREAKRSGVDLALADKMPEAVRKSLEEMGLGACVLFD